MSLPDKTFNYLLSKAEHNYSERGSVEPQVSIGHQNGNVYLEAEYKLNDDSLESILWINDEVKIKLTDEQLNVVYKTLKTSLNNYLLEDDEYQMEQSRDYLEDLNFSIHRDNRL